MQVLTTTGPQAAALPRPKCMRQSGVTLVANGGQLIGSPACTARLAGQLTGLAAARLPVALRIAGFDAGSAPEQFYFVLRELRDAISTAGLDSRSLEVTIAAGSMPLRVAWQVRRTLLGDGVLNVVLDAATISAAGNRSNANAFWEDLWQLRMRPVRSVFWPVVRSACTLLSPEAATDVVPETGLQAPAQTAWLRRVFDLRDFTDDRGHVSLPRLTRAMAHFIEQAELRYDTETWPTSAMQYDAWSNRRLAIVMAGIGDVVRRQGLDPDRHETLATLGRLLRKVRRAIGGYSRTLASRNERLPSIAATDPCLHLKNKARESCWQRRWNDALERHALRHRNLLVVSPWSLFPDDDADFRFANLLPLLAEADACEFRRCQSLQTWSKRQLQLFHCRAWALNNTVLRSMVVAEEP